MTRRKKTDLLLYNGEVVTLDPANPQCHWVAVSGGKILKTGTGHPTAAYISDAAHVVDLNGKTALPGFIDAHLHFRALSESHVTLDLSPQAGIRSISDINSRIHTETKNTPTDGWIRASAYNEVCLTDRRHPNRWDLDAASPDHPVKLTHRSGHAHVLNSRGLAFVGIGIETDDPPGGIIDRDLETGEPTGILWELGGLLSERIPPIDEAALIQGTAMADEQLLSYGITSFQDASARNDRDRWEWFESLKANGALKPRATIMLGWEGFQQFKESPFMPHLSASDLCFKGVKLIVDETTGSVFPEQNELSKMVAEIHRAGFQAALHAIEPPAIKAAIKAISNAIKAADRNDHRHRIEHCSVCPPWLIRELADFGVWVTTHPGFLYYSGDRYLETVPKSQKPYLYPIGSLIKAGIPVCAASDGPIVDINPLAGIYAAVTRKTESGSAVISEEAIAPFRAIEMSTRLPAMASFQEMTKGVIAQDMLADFAILSDNPLTVSADKIKEIVVEMTVIGGKTVWIRDG